MVADVELGEAVGEERRQLFDLRRGVQRLVAQFHRGRVAEFGDAGELLGEGEQRRRVGPPLAVVAVQEIAGSRAIEVGGEFPGKVDRILDAGVHALAARRAVHVSGITGQEDPPGPERPGQPGRDLVGAGLDDLADLGPGTGRVALIEYRLNRVSAVVAGGRTVATTRSSPSGRVASSSMPSAENVNFTCGGPSRPSARTSARAGACRSSKRPGSASPRRAFTPPRWMTSPPRRTVRRNGVHLLRHQGRPDLRHGGRGHRPVHLRALGAYLRRAPGLAGRHPGRPELRNRPPPGPPALRPDQNRRSGLGGSSRVLGHRRGRAGRTGTGGRRRAGTRAAVGR